MESIKKTINKMKKIILGVAAVIVAASSVFAVVNHNEKTQECCQVEGAACCYEGSPCCE